MGIKSNYENITRLIVLILLFGLILIALSAVDAVSADSSMIYVNDSGGNDDNDGFTWVTAKLSIKNATGTVTEGGTVSIANGVYKGVNNTGITINKNMTIKGQSREDTIISGTDSAQIFQIQSGKNVTIQNLTFANGKSTANGGAIYNYGTLTVKDSTFTGNQANYGGAIGNNNILTVNGCNFADNTATYGAAAIYGYQGDLTVNNCTFTGNTAGSSGGTIWNYGASTVNDSTFTGNTAGSSAGAIYNEGTMDVNSSTFTGNTATYNGGAIYNGGTLTVDNCTLSGNNVTQHGGAIYNYGTLTIDDCTFTGNTATGWGGAIYSTGSTSAVITVTNSNFTGNQANSGGAIYNYSGTSTVHFSRILGNTPQDIYNNGGTVNAEFNWWGSNDNPSARVSGATVTSWLVLSLNANPTTIYTGRTSTITADLLHDNGILSDPTHPELYYHNPASGHVPDGIPVLFTTDLGNIGSKSVTKYTLNGVATATLNANEGAGTATVTAALDNQSPLQKTVTILQDTTAPTVTASLPTGIYNTLKTVTLNAADNIDTNPVIYYSTDNGVTWKNQTKTVTLSLIPGKTVIKFYARDAAGNQCPIQTVTYTIDITKPTASANIKNGLYNTNKAVYLKMSEAGIIYYTRNGATPTTASTRYIGPISIISTTTLKFIAVDTAGNKSPVYTQKYTIDKTAPKVVSTYPKKDARGVSRTKNIIIKFSENIKASVNWSKIYIKNLKTGKKVKIAKKWISGNKLYLKMSSRRYAYNWYSVYIPAYAVKDYAGNKRAVRYTFKFKTGRY